MFIDSHCHLDRINLEKLGTSLSDLISAATAKQVNKMLCVSIDLIQFQTMMDAIAPFDNVWASAGVHPLHVDEQPFDEVALRSALTTPRVVAVGESGLDYYYSRDHIDAQKVSFSGHLRMAAELGLPIIVHTRDAREDTLDLISSHGSTKSAGVLHCFTESLDMAMSAVDLNYMISFSGIITFRNAEELREVVKAVPLDHILIETDSPYLAPVPFRGKQNQPAYVVEVARCVADIKGVTIEEVASRTQENFYRLFNKVPA